MSDTDTSNSNDSRDGSRTDTMSGKLEPTPTDPPGEGFKGSTSSRQATEMLSGSTTLATTDPPPVAATPSSPSSSCCSPRSTSTSDNDESNADPVPADKSAANETDSKWQPPSKGKWGNTAESVPEMGWGELPPTPPPTACVPSGQGSPIVSNTPVQISQFTEFTDSPTPAEASAKAAEVKADAESKSSNETPDMDKPPDSANSVSDSGTGPDPADTDRPSHDVRKKAKAQEPAGSRVRGSGQLGAHAGNTQAPRRNAAGSYSMHLQEMAKKQENTLRNQLNAPRNSQQQLNTNNNNNGNGGNKAPNTNNMSPGVFYQNNGNGGIMPRQPQPFTHNNMYNNFHNNYVNNMNGARPRISQGGSPNESQLSNTNLYIKGLKKETTDNDLRNMCQQYGQIKTTKAIIDKLTKQCKGYGFVDFATQEAAAKAIDQLNEQSTGLQAQMAKERSFNHYPVLSEQVNNTDDTNLYVANLPDSFSEEELNELFKNHGQVISTRILRDENSKSRGVGFARMESDQKCRDIINLFNGKPLPPPHENEQPLLVKFADSGKKLKPPHKQYNNIPQAFEQYQFGPGHQAMLDMQGVGAQNIAPSAMHPSHAQPQTMAAVAAMMPKQMPIAFTPNAQNNATNYMPVPQYMFPNMQPQQQHLLQHAQILHPAAYQQAGMDQNPNLAAMNNQFAQMNFEQGQVGAQPTAPFNMYHVPAQPHFQTMQAMHPMQYIAPMQQFPFMPNMDMAGGPAGGAGGTPPGGVPGAFEPGHVDMQQYNPGAPPPPTQQYMHAHVPPPQHTQAPST